MQVKKKSLFRVEKVFNKKTRRKLNVVLSVIIKEEFLFQLLPLLKCFLLFKKNKVAVFMKIYLHSYTCFKNNKNKLLK